MTETTAADVVADDLGRICTQAGQELARMSGQRLLIVGGAGFLGHYLVQAALTWNRRNDDAPPIAVTVFDNWSRGVPAWLDGWRGDPTLTLETVDITAPLPDDLPHYDWIIHAASIASPIYYRQHPIETMDANVNGLRHLLDYALAERDAGRPIGGFLFFSTSEIYGDPTPDNIPTPEDYRGNVSCTGPRACYDESKRYGETLCVNFAAVHDLPIRVARPFNNYGPGLKITDRRVIPDFARDILAGRDIVMLSDGAPTRTFCYVTDAVVGYYKVLVRGRDGEAYNIGTEQPEISMAELADRLVEIAREHLGYQGTVVHRTSEDPAYLTDNPNRRCPVIVKARTELGYDPIVGLDEGLRRSMVWYRDNNTAEES
jgi:UDP-glucuronate decarboxylase